MQFWSILGQETERVSYQDAREVQLLLLELRHQDSIPDTVLFLEHEPVITRGRGLQWTGVQRPKHMPIPLQLPSGISFSETERGGDLTYHGPGQLVAYPIFKLDGCGFAPFHDVAGFLRRLEGVFIEELKARGLTALNQPSATGIWIQPDSSRETRLLKIASMGIAVRKWVTYHGIAMNCVNDLSPFRLISPCGFSADVMTRLSDWVTLGQQWRSELEESLASRMVKSGERVDIKKIHVDLLRAHLIEQAVPFL